MIYRLISAQRQSPPAGVRRPARPFDLATDLMLRAALLVVADEEHVLLLTLHHIAADGWSLGILWRELAAAYAAYLRNADPALAELPVQYADYAVWQQNELEEGRQARLLQYWQQQLAGLAVLELPTDHARPSQASYQGANFDFEVPRELVEQLGQLGRREGVTLHMCLLAAFQTLLARYSGQDDIAVGVPIAGRSRAELEPLIGFFVNTLVLRTDLSARRRSGNCCAACGGYRWKLTIIKTCRSKNWWRNCSRNAISIAARWSRCYFSCGIYPGASFRCRDWRSCRCRRGGERAV